MQHNIKIAFLTPYLSTGGAERAFINIAAFFFKQKLDVQIVAATIVGNNSSKLPEGLKVFDFGNKTPLDSPALYKNTKAILKYIKSERPDVVISTSDYLNISLIIARFISKQKYKIIVSQQVNVSAYLKELPWANRQFIKLIQLVIARNADMIIGASDGVVNDFAGLYKLKSPLGKIRTIYNPIYEDKIVGLAAEKTTDENFNVQGLKLITVGRLVKQKDHATLLQAFKLVLETLPGAHLFIIGIGAEELNLKKISQQLNIEQKVTFLGYKENPYAYVSKCDLFVLSSEYEGFGNVVVEALATGTNVVSTDCPSGPAEILNNGEFGFLCPVGNAPRLSDAIIKALAHKMPASFLHERASCFSIETAAGNYMDVVFSLLK